MKPFRNRAVASVFAAYPPQVRRKLMTLRRIIFETAASNEDVGELDETLKWGEPAYLTSNTKSGSTVRIDWKRKNPDQYAMYFNCQTNLIETFRAVFADDLKYEGNRALIFNVSDPIPVQAVAFCVAASLTYHRGKRGRAKTDRVE